MEYTFFVGVVPVDLDVGPLGLQAGDHRVRGADRLQIALQQNGRSAIVAHLPGRHFNFKYNISHKQIS